MTTQLLRNVFEAARQLSDAGQAELVDLLLTGSESSPEWEAAWAEEADTRLQQMTNTVVRGSAHGAGFPHTLAGGDDEPVELRVNRFRSCSA